ncbi:MAG: hypothetical protein PUP91_15850 [Rhizonema sp. PD37]|nr:hypothetical protein [Rhizonema sp. PD37]
MPVAGYINPREAIATFLPCKSGRRVQPSDAAQFFLLSSVLQLY